MATFVRHRVNAPAGVAGLDPGEGAEIDLRSHAAGGEALYLAHDPWAAGAPLGPWLDAFAARPRPGPLFVNTKEDGLEARFMAEAAARQIGTYVFLDTAMPTLVRLLRAGYGRHLCARLSAYEPLAAVAALCVDADVPRPAWIWADCFDGVPLPVATLRAAGRLGKICLVSPELQGRPAAAIADFVPLRGHVDAVCSKYPAAWQDGAARPRGGTARS